MDRRFLDAWNLTGRRFFWVFACLAWIAAVVVGLGEMWTYENRPGVSATAPEHEVRLAAGSNASTAPLLVLLAHPRCPCTGATIDELAELMSRASGALNARVYFYHPRAAGESWAHTALWKRAERIPRVEVVADAEGKEARRLGSVTSGQALLYGADGTLLFSGGLTDARGHAGESAGRRAVLSFLAHSEQARATTPVFGCPISNAGVQGKLIR
jgi:hypothetical protein